MINTEYHHTNLLQYHEPRGASPRNQTSSPRLRSRIRNRKTLTMVNEDGASHRKRVGVACGRCRKRKIRCSGENPLDPSLPCDNCQNAGHSPCRFLRPFSTETALMENEPAARSSQETRHDVHPLATCSSSSSLDGGMSGFFNVPHGDHNVKPQGGYHIGSAIRSTLPRANDYPTDNGMFSVSSTQSYSHNDPYLLGCRSSHAPSFAHMPTAYVNDQANRSGGHIIYYGNDTSLAAHLPLRSPIINLGVSYPLMTGEAASCSSPSSTAYTTQSSENYEPMAESLDSLWNTKSEGSEGNRSAKSVDFQYRYHDTTAYRAALAYWKPLPSQRAAALGSNIQPTRSPSAIGNDTRHDSSRCI